MMKKIDSYLGKASKLRTGAPLDYCLWEDENRVLYVQIEKNRSKGKFSKHLYPVVQYKELRNVVKALGPLEGYDLEAKKFISHTNNNNGAFLKAALRHLFDGDHGELDLLINDKFNPDYHYVESSTEGFQKL